jgi:histone H3/H4
VAEPVAETKEEVEEAPKAKGKGKGKAKAKGGKGKGKAKEGGKAKAATKGGKKKGAGGVHRNPKRTYKAYVYKVLKSVMPGAGVTSRGAEILNSMVMDLSERIAREAIQLARAAKRHTLSSGEIEAATKIVLGTGELSQKTVDFGKRAVSTYIKSKQ